MRKSLVAEASYWDCFYRDLAAFRLCASGSVIRATGHASLYGQDFLLNLKGGLVHTAGKLQPLLVQPVRPPASRRSLGT